MRIKYTGFFLLLCCAVFLYGCGKGKQNENTSSDAVETDSPKPEDSVKPGGGEKEADGNKENSGDEKEGSQDVTDKGKDKDAAGKEEPKDSLPPDGEQDKSDKDGLIVKEKGAISGMADVILQNMTLEEKIGQMFIVNLELLDDSKGAYYEHTAFTKRMGKSMSRFPAGGIVFFSRNAETAGQTKELVQSLQEASKIPLFIAVDEEGGDVARLGSNKNLKLTQFPTMEEVGAMGDEEYAYEMGAIIGREIKELGFNLDFAPVADVRTNEKNTEIGSRSFGSDKNLAARMVSQVVKGLKSQNVASTLKHFPGLGDTAENSHEGAVNVDNDLNRLRDVEFVPFRAGIKAGADLVMVSHISVSRITGTITPASMTELVMNEMLRTELGFEGVIITDAMDMKCITEYYKPEKAALEAIKAGADIVLMPEDLEKAFESVLNAVDKGTLSEKQIDESVRRILELKIRRGIILADTDLINKDGE